MYNETEYNTVTLSFRDGHTRSFELHRIIALIYCWNQDQDYTKQVNHIDGVKGHNWAWNLEWCTNQENMIHCINTGLMTLGEDRNNSIFTNEQVEYICQLISEGKTNEEIRYITGIEEGNIFKLIQNIKNGHCWKHISCNFDFSNAAKKEVFDIETVHKVCKFFQDYGRERSYKEVLDHIGFDYSNLDDKELNSKNVYISGLRKKKFNKDICNQYEY